MLGMVVRSIVVSHLNRCANNRAEDVIFYPHIHKPTFPCHIHCTYLSLKKSCYAAQCGRGSACALFLFPPQFISSLFCKQELLVMEFPLCTSIYPCPPLTHKVFTLHAGFAVGHTRENPKKICRDSGPLDNPDGAERFISKIWINKCYSLIVTVHSVQLMNSDWATVWFGSYPERPLISERFLVVCLRQVDISMDCMQWINRKLAQFQ